MLKDPGVPVRDKNRVQAGGKCRIDVGLRAITDHPRGVARQRILRNDVVIRRYVLLGDNFDGSKVTLKPGALNFPRFSGMAPLVTRMRWCRTERYCNVSGT